MQIVAYAGYCVLSGPTTRAANTSDYANITPGNYGFEVLTPSNPAELTKTLNAGIDNGRVAIMAIMGMFFLSCIIPVINGKLSGGSWCPARWPWHSPPTLGEQPWLVEVFG